MQTYNNFQNTALLILRIITAAIFSVAAYYKFPFWSGAPEDISAFLLFTTRLLSSRAAGSNRCLDRFLTRLAAAGQIIILLGAIYVQFVLE
jgi:uncharacterized membrane protein YphA (DoxX/SURF4 family)